jgi:hypothetical protein
MGMDVYGRNPKTNENSVKPKDINFHESTEEQRDNYYATIEKYEKENPGQYFRANVWSWRPIHELICRFSDEHFTETGKILIEEPVLVNMGMNDGEGPETDWQCQELARRFQVWMEHNANGATLESDCRVEVNTGRFVKVEEEPDTPTVSAYGVDDEHLKEFVTFLENCGGFQVH